MSQIPVHIPPTNVFAYHDIAYGSWGEFTASGSSVLYLSAHMTLAANALEGGNSLVESLSPVRELLDSKQMSFAELLQRDLEDHRVAYSLIPYLLDQANDGVAFFPPILAVLLPFDGTNQSSFSEPTTQYSQMDGLWTQQIESPGYFRFKRVAHGENQPLVRSQRSGQLEWNRNKSRLVIIDGQHRAMALLAIYRSHADKWSQGSAGRYKHFYDSIVKGRLNGKPMPPLEIPVTICVFQDFVGPEKGSDIFRAARRLFVDVNKEAKAPNPSRLILLSESNLTDIFTRSLLDELRSINLENTVSKALPLASIEYDTPGAAKSGAQDPSPQRRICILTVRQLRQVVEHTIWGSLEWVKYVNKENARQVRGSDSFMHRQLGLTKDGETMLLNDNGQPIMELSDLSREEFTTEAVEVLKKRFVETWGIALIHVFSNLDPYATFADALTSFEQSWNVVEDAESALAKEALFDGVGTYWTIREYAETWEKRHDGVEPSASLAWKIVKKKEDEFVVLRDELLIGHSSLNPSEKAAAQDLFRKISTQAVTSGIAMSLATLVLHLDAYDRVVEFAKEFTKRINQFLESSTSSGKPRRHFLSPKQPSGSLDDAFFAFRDSLEPRKWVYVRWLILEAFFSSPFEWSDEIVELVGLDNLQRVGNGLLGEVRPKMLAVIQKEHIDALGRDSTEEERTDEASRVLSLMMAKYKEWFGLESIFENDGILSSTSPNVEELDDDDDDNDEEQEVNQE